MVSFTLKLFTVVGLVYVIQVAIAEKFDYVNGWGNTWGHSEVAIFQKRYAVPFITRELELQSPELVSLKLFYSLESREDPLSEKYFSFIGLE